MAARLILDPRVRTGHYVGWRAHAVLATNLDEVQCTTHTRDVRDLTGSSAHAPLRRDVGNWREGIGNFVYG